MNLSPVVAMPVDDYKEVGVVRVAGEVDEAGEPCEDTSDSDFLGVFLDPKLFLTSGQLLRSAIAGSGNHDIQVVPVSAPSSKLLPSSYDLSDGSQPLEENTDLAVICFDEDQRWPAGSPVPTWPRLTNVKVESAIATDANERADLYVIALGLMPNATSDLPSLVRTSDPFTIIEMKENWFLFRSFSSSYSNRHGGTHREVAEIRTSHMTELNLGSPVYLPGTHDLIGIMNEYATAAFRPGVLRLSRQITLPSGQKTTLAEWASEKIACLNLLRRQSVTQGLERCCPLSMR